MKTVLNHTISLTAPSPSGATNCGRNAKKKMVSFGFSVFTKTPDTITRHGDTVEGPSCTSNTDLSRNVFHAKYTRYAPPSTLVIENATALACMMAANPVTAAIM